MMPIDVATATQCSQERTSVLLEEPSHFRLDPTLAATAGPRPDISVVIPVYLGESTLEKLVDRLRQTFERSNRTFEIILVDDDSRDNSWQVIQSLAQRDARILGVKLARNFGQHNATLCGFRFATAPLIVTLDEDLQHPPEAIDTMIATMREKNADVVYGIPAQRKHSWWRRLGSRLIMLVPRHVMKIDFDIGSFRLVNAAVAKAVTNATRHDIIIDIYFAWLTSRISAVEVPHDDGLRDRGSSYPLRKLLSILLNLICNYTVLPLRAASLMGATLSVVSLILTVYFVLVRLIEGVPVQGFTAIIVSVLFSTGMILLGIGVMSEYLARTFMHINQRPQSAVRTTTRNHQPGIEQDVHYRTSGTTVPMGGFAAATREKTDVSR